MLILISVDGNIMNRRSGQLLIQFVVNVVIPSEKIIFSSNGIKENVLMIMEETVPGIEMVFTEFA